MKIYTLKRKTIVAANLETTWDYFSNPKNLASITPPDMAFVIKNPQELPDKIYAGLLISYQVKPLLGIAVNWLTEIKKAEAPFHFIDEQRFGPYAFWYHEHFFEGCHDGRDTLMTDHVRYGLPLGVLGRLANAAVVAPKLARIFDYRKRAIGQIFPERVKTEV